MARLMKSILLFAALVWVGGLENEVNRKRLNSAYRPIVLRVCSIVSGEAACVITGINPFRGFKKEGDFAKLLV